MKNDDMKELKKQHRVYGAVQPRGRHESSYRGVFGQAQMAGWLAAVFCVCLQAGGARGQETKDGWRLVFADDFNRPAIGANWRWVFGDGRQYVRENAIHLSHSSTVYCVVPLPHGQTRVEMDLLLPSQSFSGARPHLIALELRGGEVGGGGNHERFEAALIPQSEPSDPKNDPPGTLRIALDQPYHVAMQIRAGTGAVELNGKPMFEKAVSPDVSEVNRYFVFNTKALNGIPGKEVVLDNFQIWAGPKSAAKLPLAPNTPEQNRLATCDAADFIDPANPALGMQRAIDSLPPGGGVVVLPTGAFLMRRHLRLRNNVTLRGQGAGKTILKACHDERAAILAVKPSPGQCVVTVAPQDAEKFQVGDAVCFDERWGHPGYLDAVNKDCVVADVSGGQITVKGVMPGASAYDVSASLPGGSSSSSVPQPKELRHWFPLVYAHCAEFVELKDLTIVGGNGGWGGFESAAVTFGQVAGARVSRVQVAQWEGDGLSFQTGGDTIVTDNTVSNAYQGYHPGTITQRFLWTRNLGLGNKSCGLYFCWFNRNGVYHRGTIDRFDGYGWPFDIFNILTRNVSASAKDFAIEQSEGGGGVVFNNRFPRIRVGNDVSYSPTYDFVVAENRADDLRFVDGIVQRNLFVGNRSCDGGRLTMVAETRDKNAFAGRGAELDLDHFQAGIERTTPVDPPDLPQPILDGAKFYRPEKPDAGFQAALNQLAKKGGTLLLPGGRYGLSQPLRVPGGVTLAGRGLGTILHAAKPSQTGSLIVVNQAARVTVRDLVILGEYERRDFRSAAIQLNDVAQGELAAIDMRGWEGPAIKIKGGDARVGDCRALGCAGNGFDFAGCRVTCVGNIARECANGFVVSRCAADSLLEANISSGNRANGYQLEEANGIRLYANNASYNDQDGIVATDTKQAELIANMLANNNQSDGEGCGIRLSGGTNACRLHYNNLQDNQPQPSQVNAIIEESSAGHNVIRFNLLRAKIQAAGQGSTISDNYVP